MSLLAGRYDRWKAPAADGEFLIWPPPAELLADTRDNHARLLASSGIRIQNVPLPELRRHMRGWMGHRDDSSPLLGTGHQTELYHPGVWAKNLLIDAAASRLGGSAIHFAVDTDEPKHLQIRVPGGAVALLDHSEVALPWSGLLRSPSPDRLSHVEQYLGDHCLGWNFRSLIPRFLASLNRHAPQAPNLPTALTQGLHELDESLGLRHQSVLASRLWMSPPYLVFVHHVLSHIDRFAIDYNAALAAYRAENKIRSPGRPMPDLACVGNTCEAPFWLDSLSQQTRVRARVTREAGGAFSLVAPPGDADCDRFEFHPAADGWDSADRLLSWLQRNDLRLSPRALTLTAVLRLLVVDQFVHGIGGGQYDQVLDGLIQRHFDLAPPRFSVTTATLYFPDAAGQPRVCLPCIQQEGRRLRHDALGGQKMEIVNRIGQLPRRSAQRSELFFDMHDRLSRAWKGEKIQNWQSRYLEAERRSAAERVRFDRELFYAVQSENRLTNLIAEYRLRFE